MVSFQKLNSSSQFEYSSSNKRKLEDQPKKPLKVERTKFFGIEFHKLEKNIIPKEEHHQHSLDIHQSKRHKTCEGTMRRSPERLSLELELNLSCKSFKPELHDDKFSHSLSSPLKDLVRQTKAPSSDKLTRCLSSLEFEEDQQEMVAAVCMRCHMLVMLCKASPLCPNCPSKLSLPSLIRPRFKLLCCKDQTVLF
ncbi:hypothetical protein GIB67_013919 [Kingdonia uniflora]|uniref:Uncharacterized protein n=1 Tax=Kingdonia uniflora TaxID=39325 RepID=A0A7J7LD82_9MAGN|nr:hypothetical protein GIB67_013919 [Kingdonia uniflora]